MYPFFQKTPCPVRKYSNQSATPNILIATPLAGVAQIDSKNIIISKFFVSYRECRTSSTYHPSHSPYVHSVWHDIIRLSTNATLHYLHNGNLSFSHCPNQKTSGHAFCDKGKIHNFTPPFKNARSIAAKSSGSTWHGGRTIQETSGHAFCDKGKIRKFPPPFKNTTAVFSDFSP